MVTRWSPSGHQVSAKTWIYNSLSILNNVLVVLYDIGTFKTYLKKNLIYFLRKNLLSLCRDISFSPHTLCTTPSSSGQDMGSFVWIFVDQLVIILGMIIIHKWCESKPAGLHLSWHPWVGLLVPHPVSRLVHLAIGSIPIRFLLQAKMHFIKHFHLSF